MLNMSKQCTDWSSSLRRLLPLLFVKNKRFQLFITPPDPRVLTIYYLPTPPPIDKWTQRECVEWNPVHINEKKRRQFYFPGPWSHENRQNFWIRWGHSLSLNISIMDWDKLALLSFTESLGYLWPFGVGFMETILYRSSNDSFLKKRGPKTSF